MVSDLIKREEGFLTSNVINSIIILNYITESFSNEPIKGEPQTGAV